MAYASRPTAWRQIRRIYTVAKWLCAVVIVGLLVHAFWRQVYDHFWMTCGGILILAGLVMGTTPSYTRDDRNRF